MGFLSWNKGSHRDSMAAGEDTGRKSFFDKAAGWFNKAKSFGQKVLSNKHLYGLANMGYDYLRKKGGNYEKFANIAQGTHRLLGKHGDTGTPLALDKGYQHLASKKRKAAPSAGGHSLKRGNEAMRNLHNDEELYR